jgi:hypothetical protein
MLPNHFQTLRSRLELNETTQERVSGNHRGVRSAIENIDPNVKTRLIGSLGRSTNIQPRENAPLDIDILVILGEFDRWLPTGSGISAQDALNHLQNVVESSDRYSGYAPKQDAPTVSFSYADGTRIELVPAYIDNIGVGTNGELVPPKGRGYWVPKKGRWEHADYDYEQEFITRKNKEAGEMLVPAMKMIKAIKREHFPTMGSFQLDILASHLIPSIVTAMNQQGTQKSYPGILRLFFALAPQQLSSNLTIPGSNSAAIENNSYLTAVATAKMLELAAYIERIYQATTIQDQIHGWKVVFGGDVFPTTV